MGGILVLEGLAGSGVGGVSRGGESVRRVHQLAVHPHIGPHLICTQVCCMGVGQVGSGWGATGMWASSTHIQDV